MLLAPERIERWKKIYYAYTHGQATEKLVAVWSSIVSSWNNATPDERERILRWCEGDPLHEFFLGRTGATRESNPTHYRQLDAFPLDRPPSPGQNTSRRERL